MKVNPKVSTITACYKKENYLEKFLEDLPDQTYFSDLEIVIDHNEPTNNEIEWIRHFQKKFPDSINHLVTNPVEPLGVSWNRCIRESSGEYLTIWNIDDLRTPFSIEKQATVLNENQGIDIITGNYTVVPSFPSHIGDYVDITKYDRTEFSKLMLLGPFFMFRKKMCEKAGIFDEQFRCANDYDFAIRLMYHGKLEVINENLGYFLDEGKGASTRPDSICPVESTVIQLRYGNYDYIDYRYLPPALKYNIYNLKMGDEWIPVADIIPHYESMLEEKFENLSTRGFYLKLKTDVRKKLKKLIKNV